MKSNVEIVTAIYEAFARRDPPGFLQLLDPQFEMIQTELLPWGGHYRGTEEAMSFFGKLTQHITSMPRVEEMVEAGDHIVAIGHVGGKVNASGQPFIVRFVHVWTLRDGKAVRFEAYIDTPAMLRALELPGTESSAQEAP